MAHFRRNHPKHRTFNTTKSMNSWPAWHDVLFHRRPARRRAKKITNKVFRDLVDVEETTWDTGGNKPHTHYW